MVGRTAYERKGVFKCAPKVSKNQFVTAGRLIAVLDMRPVTTNTTTTNRAALLTAPATPTLILGLFMLHTYHMKDHNQAQTLSGMWHYHLH